MNSGLNANTQSAGLKANVQAFGRFLSGMVMPNIPAFIAWGFITALFIPTGWMPNEYYAALVGPMIVNLLPLLIGYTGGRMVGGQRGAVVAATATMGVIVGNGSPQFMAAMVAGPIAGFLMKKIDEALEGNIPSGFEMLVNNFSAGFLGLGLALINYVAIGPIFAGVTAVLTNIIQGIVDMGALPLVSLIIEPGKILFLNNAINHGVLSPIGIQQAAETGKSIIFMLESNPGPGLGVLLAYAVFAKGMAKQSAPGAIIIHFLGGIHEIYFPYVLMNPILILAVIGGGMSAIAIEAMLGAGLVSPPSPGSIFAYIITTPKGGFFPVMAGVAVGAVVSFLIASVFVKSMKEEGDLSEAQDAVKGMKAASKGEAPAKAAPAPAAPAKLVKTRIKKAIVACDAGMGSSAMGASILKNKVKKAGFDIQVTNKAIDELPQDVDVVFTHSTLTPRAMKTAPNARHISLENFVDTPVYDEFIAELQEEMK